MPYNIDHGNKRTFGKRRSFLKIKHLRLVTPERANELGIPAEAPVLCSPYTSGGYCQICKIQYTPLIYQVGQTTEAQHFCKEAGGGIYVQIPEDHSTTWVYEPGLFTASVQPSGPIRMGQDRGYQFRSVKPLYLHVPRCYDCHEHIAQGHIEINYNCHFQYEYQEHNLVPICLSCHSPAATHRNTEWQFILNDGTLSFTTSHRLTLPDNAGVLKGRY